MRAQVVLVYNESPNGAKRRTGTGASCNAHLFNEGFRMCLLATSQLCAVVTDTLHNKNAYVGPPAWAFSIRLPPVLCRCCASLVQPGQQSNIGSAVYSNPELYDRAFSLRDFTEEVRAHLLLHWRYQTHTQAAWTVMCIATMQVDFLETIFSSCVKSGPGSFLELG